MDNKQILEALDDIVTFREEPTSEQIEALIEAMDIVEKYSEIGGWILCSERMPEENEEVICCFKSGVVKALVLFNCKFHGKVYAYEKSDIIAWQPLPEEYHG